MIDNYETYIRNLVLLPDLAMLDIADQANEFAGQCLRVMGAPAALVTLVDQSKWLYELAARRGAVRQEDQAAEVAIAVASIFESVYALNGQMRGECFGLDPDEDVLKCHPKSDNPSQELREFILYLPEKHLDVLASALAGMARDNGLSDVSVKLEGSAQKKRGKDGSNSDLPESS